MSPSARDWLLFGGVPLVAFVGGGIAFGGVEEILDSCAAAGCGW